MDVPLIVTRDETLLEELLRLCAAAGVVPEVVRDARAAVPPWATAPVVLVGVDVAAELARASPLRRPDVVVLSHGPVPSEAFQAAVGVGAEQVVELPRSESWVIERLSDLEESLGGLVVAVVGASGGVGASVFACALGQVAAREGPVLVVDADPLGPGLDRVLGFDLLDGIGWDALAQTTGRIGAGSLRDAVPRRKHLGLLGWATSTSSGPPGAPTALAPFAVRQALASARRGHRLVVVDLSRRFDAVGEEVLSHCDQVLLVVAPTLTGLASGGRVRSRLGRDRPVRLVVRRPGLDPVEVGRLLRCAVAAELPDQRHLGESVDLGLGPVRSRRGPLGRAAAAVLEGLPWRPVGDGPPVRDGWRASA